MARAQVLRTTGGYPCDFFVYHNEFPVAISARLKGYHIKRFSDIVFYHLGVSSQDASTFAVRRFYYPFRNLLLLYDWYWRVLNKLNAAIYYGVAACRSGAFGVFVRAFFGAVAVSLCSKHRRERVPFIKEYDHYLVRPYRITLRRVARVLRSVVVRSSP